MKRSVRARTIEKNRWKRKFAYELRSLMESRGIDEIKLAELSDLSQPCISNYLNGKCIPIAYNLYKICKALGVPTDTLMDF